MLSQISLEILLHVLWISIQSALPPAFFSQKPGLSSPSFSFNVESNPILLVEVSRKGCSTFCLEGKQTALYPTCLTLPCLLVISAIYFFWTLGKHGKLVSLNVV